MIKYKYLKINQNTVTQVVGYGFLQRNKRDNTVSRVAAAPVAVQLKADGRKRLGSTAWSEATVNYCNSLAPKN